MTAGREESAMTKGLEGARERGGEIGVEEEQRGGSRSRSEARSAG